MIIFASAFCKESPKVENFIKYAFFIQNLDSFKTILPVLINDISVGEVESEKVSYFIDWFNNTKDLKFKSLMCSPSSVAQNNNSIINTIVNSTFIVIIEYISNLLFVVIAILPFCNNSR